MAGCTRHSWLNCHAESSSATQANVEDIPLAQRKRLIKAPASPSGKGGVPPAIVSKKAPVAKPPVVQASIEDIPLAQRKRASAKPPASPFATAEAVDPYRRLMSSVIQGRNGPESAQPMSVTGAMTAKASDSQPQATAVRKIGAVAQLSADAPGKAATAAKDAAQLKDTAARGASPSKERVLHRSDSITASSDASKSRPKTSSASLGQGSLSRSRSVKNMTSDAVRPVKGLPALSRSLNKKGGSTSQIGAVKKAVSLSSKEQAAKAEEVVSIKTKVAFQVWPVMCLQSVLGHAFAGALLIHVYTSVKIQHLQHKPRAVRGCN